MCPTDRWMIKSRTDRQGERERSILQSLNVGLLSVPVFCVISGIF
jgi:hypothetical protein